MNTIQRRRARFGLSLVVFFATAPIAGAQTLFLPQACLDCHGSETKYPMRGARSQYLTSGHKNLGNASYANSDDCQGCHTNEGFVERAKTGKVDPKKLVANPSEIGC